MALRQLSSSLVSFGLKTQFYPAFAVRGFSTVLDNLKYAKSHEWAKAEGDVATIGISDHAQAELGDVVYVELPEVGKTVKKGETFGVVESVKAASDVYAPISGEVTEINEALKENPGSINKEPYDGAWMIKIKMSNKAELNDLMDSAAYTKHSAH